MWRQEEVVTLEVWERGWVGKEWASQGAHELKIQASSAILCTCKASGQKGGKQGIGTREAPTFTHFTWYFTNTAQCGREKFLDILYH